MRIVKALPASPTLLLGGMSPWDVQSWSQIPLQVQCGHHKSTYTPALTGFPCAQQRGTLVGTQNQGCSYNNLGWLSYLSLRIYLAVIPVFTGQCDMPAPASTIYHVLLSVHEVPACWQLGIFLTLVPSDQQ